MPGFFHSAKDTTVNGGVFTEVNNIVNHNETYSGGSGRFSDPISFLRKYSATAGLLNARERFDAPKCDDGTRQSVIQGMTKWVQDGGDLSGPSMYWLHGPAGVGKSALAQSLALVLEKEHHAASFFFSRNSPGRNNGGQLILTLACQLAVHIPEIRPFLSKSLEDNPFVVDSSNQVQVDKLIIEPLNAMQHTLSSDGRLSKAWQFVRDLGKSKSPKIPRLILVDGLDECANPDVQCDLIKCLARVVRDIDLPLRILVASRPDAHILSTFRFDPLFNSAEGITLLEQNLGDDPNAEHDIATFLINEFVQIRKTHLLRRYLPEHWPQQADIDHLVQKSSKSFIYAATVIRYIKLPNNRPKECLERILGMAEIPPSDKPYQILDDLYHHIFESVPDSNKASIRDIFHVLIVGARLYWTPLRLGFCTTPAIIEQILQYERGHVEHVLGDLLCVLNVSSPHQPILILHASLSDFFLDIGRARHLYIDPRKAHSMIARGYHRLCVQTEGRFPNGFNRLLLHTKHAGSGLYGLPSVDLVQCHRWAYSRMLTLRGEYRDFVESSLSIATFLWVLPVENYPVDTIMKQVERLQDYLVQTFPAVDAARRTITDADLADIIPNLQLLHQNHWLLSSLLEGFDYGAIRREIVHTHIFALVPILLPEGGRDMVFLHEDVHAQLCVVWMKSLFETNTRSDFYTITPLCLALLSVSMRKAAYDPGLLSFLKSIQTYTSHVTATVLTDDIEKVEVIVLEYLRRMQNLNNPLPIQAILAGEISEAESVWQGLGSRWAVNVPNVEQVVGLDS